MVLHYAIIKLFNMLILIGSFNYNDYVWRRKNSMKISYLPVKCVICLFITCMSSFFLSMVAGYYQIFLLMYLFLFVMAACLVLNVVIQLHYFRCPYCAQRIRTETLLSAKRNVRHCSFCGKQIEFK